MPYRKNQLKSFPNEKLTQIMRQQTDGESLLTIKEIIAQRNQNLIQKKQQLRKQLQRVRKQSQKVLKHLNQAVRDRVEKKQKIILDKNTRPNQEDIKNLTQLFKYFENQNILIDRNNQSIDDFLIMKQNKVAELSSNQSSLPDERLQDLDKNYAYLQDQCKIQQQKLTKKKKQFNDFQKHMQKINQTIQQNRKKYQQVEDIIRKREVQLDHLCTYFNNRCQEDAQTILRESKVTQMLESQLLKGQTILNFTSQKINELKISQFQSNTDQTK